MSDPSISRFVKASLDSKPVEEPFTAPVRIGNAHYDFKTVLQTLADYRTESGINYYHSLSLWGEGHSSWEHEGSTCLHFGLDEEPAAEAAAILDDVGLLHYRIPITNKRKAITLFVFPSEDHFDHRETMRAASLLIEMLGVKGIVMNTYLSTFFWCFQKGAQVTQHGELILNRSIIDDYHGLYVEMKKWLA